MASLRLLIVLSIVVLHSAQDDLKCYAGRTIYKSNSSIEKEEGYKLEGCPTSRWCRLVITRNEESHQYTLDFGCAPAPGSQPEHKCLAKHSGEEHTLTCVCPANPDSLCNRPKFLFDSEGDAGQKERAASVKTIGIDSLSDLKNGERGTKLVWNAEFGKKCIKWNAIAKSTKESCPSAVCFMKLERIEADKKFKLNAGCATDEEKNAIASDKMSECKRQSNELKLNCYCKITDMPYCNSPQSLFDDKGTDEQRKRNDQLSGIGIGAVTSDDGKHTDLHWDEYFGEKCMKWNTIVKSDGEPEQTDIPKDDMYCWTGVCIMKLKRNEATFELEARCATKTERDANKIPPGKNTTCRTIPEDLTSTCFCKISTIVCNTVVNLFNHHDGRDQLTRYQRLRVIGLDTNLEKKEIYQTLEGDIKFDNEFRKTTTTEATTTTLYTGPYEPPFADDPHYEELEDAATGLSLTFIVLIAMLRLI